MTVTTTGEVFTRRWVVELMLDMAGYVGDVAPIRVVEPSIGSGSFISVIVERLVATGADWHALGKSLRGYDLRPEHVETCKRLAHRILTNAGCPIPDTLVDEWFHTADFLLTDVPEADLVIGNPPYIRIEHLDPNLLSHYRRTCPTMGGRADIFVGFIERGLDLLAPGGRLVYICADRWMRNGYGRLLRGKVARAFSVDDVIVLHDADCFEHEVSAYPAITNISRRPQGPVNVARATELFGAPEADRYLRWRASSDDTYVGADAHAARLAHWHTTDSVWPDGTPEDLAWLEGLSGLPLLEEAGVQVGIGIATGADRVYITRDLPNVELDRLIPMVTPKAIKGPSFDFTGEHLVSPWDGRALVDIDRYPLLRRYYSQHGEQLRSRNVAKRTQRWWRTIDSFNPALLKKSLIVMQDLKHRAHPVRVPAGFYPHHGLTWLASDEWDLDTLGGLMLSHAVERQVSAHCVKMRGGTLRFQPTVLRMVRIPRPADIPSSLADTLAEAFRSHDRDRANAAAAELFPTAGAR